MTLGRLSTIARSLLCFQGLLWIFTLAVSFYLCAFPVLRNLWAYYTWDRVPCWHAKDGNKFFFEREGVFYYGHCHTFWDSLDLGVVRATSQFSIRSDDSICFKKPMKFFSAYKQRA